MLNKNLSHIRHLENKTQQTTYRLHVSDFVPSYAFIWMISGAVYAYEPHDVFNSELWSGTNRVEKPKSAIKNISSI